MELKFVNAKTGRSFNAAAEVEFLACKKQMAVTITELHRGYKPADFPDNVIVRFENERKSVNQKMMPISYMTGYDDEFLENSASVQLCPAERVPSIRPIFDGLSPLQILCAIPSNSSITL